MRETIEAMKNAYAAWSDGRADIPLRTSLAIPPREGTSLFMPAYVREKDEDALAVKVVSVFPQNPKRGIPLIQAAVLLLDAETGAPAAFLEGSALTAIRTGAAAGAATDILARRESRVAAVIGAGVQGRTQLEAVCAVRSVERAYIYDADPARAETFVREMAGIRGIPRDLRAATSVDEALDEADILCTATTSSTPVYDAAALPDGLHINGIGSYTLDMIENPPELMTRAAVFVDARPAAIAEAGEIVAAIRAGFLENSEIAELGEVILGRVPGRVSDSQITFFKSVGIAAQDALAARLALKNAEAMNLGEIIAF
jgi:ornithine cyclodeaminase